MFNVFYFHRKLSTMKLIILTTIISLFSLTRMNSLLAQEIKWGNEQENIFFEDRYLDQGNGNFYVFGRKGPSDGPFVLKHYSSLDEDGYQKIERTIEGKTTSFAGICLLKEQLWIFLSIKEKDSYLLYAQLYNDQCLPEGNPIKIDEYYTEGQSFGFTVALTDFFVSTFKVVASENNKYFSVFHELPEAGKGDQRFGTKVFDEDMNVISEGQHVTPHAGREIKFSDFYLSNTGVFYVGARIYNTDVRGVKTNLKDYVFLRCGNTLQEMTIISGIAKMQGQETLFSIQPKEDSNGIFSVVGVCQGKSDKSRNAYFLKYDFDNGTWVTESFVELPEKLDKAVGFYVSEFTSDGGVILIPKIIEITVSTAAIYFLKINSNNSIGYCKEIPRSTIDRTQDISMHVENNVGYLLFQDRADAYDASGNQLENRTQEDEYFKSASVCLAYMKVNLDGECDVLDRQLIYKSDMRGPKYPVLSFVWNETNKEVLLVTGYRAKRMYGIFGYL